jgi:DNA-binding NarL/FixJ family response regulator
LTTTILLIEDNPGDAVIFREKLNASDLEYKLATAKRLSEGLDRLRDTDFDIILVDLSLPDTQGLEAVTKVREAAPDRPLIVLTGLDDATAAAEAKKQGAVDYLVKWYVDSVSLARYIRYAIAQYQMYEGGEAGGERRKVGATDRPQRPPSTPQVVEGKVLGQQEEAEAAVAVFETEEPEAQPQEEPEGDLKEALESAEAALLVVLEEGRVAFASEAARAWVPGDEYPWPVERGCSRMKKAGQALEQHVSQTRWGGAEAYLVSLRVVEEQAAPAPSGDRDLLRETSEAALSFVEDAVQRNSWMADVLRSALDLHRLTTGDVEVRPADIDLLEIAQQVAREHRSLAMSYGLPLRTTSKRKKAIAYTDRNLVDSLLNRLVVDAVHAAGAEGVEVTIEVEKDHSVVEVAWSEGMRAAEPAVEACLTLGQRLAEHMTELAGGESRHERDRSGHHVFSVRLPCRTAK